MKTIPYSINEANGKPVMSLAWNEEYNPECEPLTVIAEPRQTTFSIEEEDNE
jgi:hypothetical protein